MPHNPRLFRSLSLVLTGFALSLALFARPAAGGLNQWTPFGPGGGTVLTLAVDPSVPRTLYALVEGADMYTNNAIFKSTDGGVSWTFSGDGIPADPAQLSQALALDPARPWILYTAVCRGTASEVFHTTNGGLSWSSVAQLPVDGPMTRPPTCLLAVAPGNQDAVYFATGKRLMLSADQGWSWTLVFTAPAEIRSLLIDPRDPRSLYVGTSEGGGLWRSLDRGLTFTAVAGFSSAEALAASPLRPRLYAASGQDVYSSRDGGATWLWQGETGSPVRTLAVDFGLSARLYAGLDRGMAVSRDGGATWTPSSVGLPYICSYEASTGPYRAGVLALAPHPVEPGTVYAGIELAGVYQTQNGGRTWTAGDQLGLNGASLRWLVFSPASPYTVCTTTANRLGAFWCSVDEGRSWELRSTAYDRGFYINHLVFDPLTPGQLYAAGKGASGGPEGIFRSFDGGATWTSLRLGAMSWSSSVQMAGPGVMLALAAEGVIRSDDGGSSWTTVLSPSGPSGERQFLSLRADPAAAATLYAGVWEEGLGPNGWGDVGVYRSQDGGLTWKLCIVGAQEIVTVPGMPGILYAIVQPSYGRTQTVLRSADGETWTEVFRYPEGILTSLAVDGLSPETLYTSSYNRGVLRSTDGGATWRTVNAGLPRLGYFFHFSLMAHPVTPHSFFAFPGTGNGPFIAWFPPSGR